MKEVSDTARKKIEKKLLPTVINPDSITNEQLRLISELYNSQRHVNKLHHGYIEFSGGAIFHRPSYTITMNSEDGSRVIIKTVKFTSNFTVYPTVLLKPELVNLVEDQWLAFVHEQHPKITQFNPGEIYLSKLPDHYIIGKIYYKPFRVSKPLIIYSPKELNPRALTIEGRELLLLLLKHHPNTVFFDGNHSVIERRNKYIIPRIDPQQPEIIAFEVVTLKHSLVRYVRKNSDNFQDFRYAVLNDNTDMSGFESTGFYSDSTLKIQNGNGAIDIFLKEKSPQKCRFIKMFVPPRDEGGHLRKDEDGDLVDSRTQNNKAMREWQFLKKISIFAVKEPIITKDNSRAALIMRRFEGRSFIQYIIEDAGDFVNDQYVNNTGNIFTIDQRIEITIMAGEAIINYVHHYGIVNRDIKPDNMILKVDSHNNPLEFRIIDFGYAKWEYEHNLIEYCGTQLYKSPEAKEGMHTTIKSDAYSYAVTLDSFWEAIFHAKKYKDLADVHKIQIVDIVEKGLEKDMEKRASIESIVAVFKNIKDERHQETKLNRF